MITKNNLNLQVSGIIIVKLSLGVGIITLNYPGNFRWKKIVASSQWAGD